MQTQIHSCGAVIMLTDVQASLKEIYREYRQFSGYISKRVWLSQIQLNCMGVS